MIIWSRWGILVVPFIGIGVALGFLVKTIAGSTADRGAEVGVFIGIGLVLSAALLWVVVRYTVGKVIDKPKPAVMHERLAEPIRHENGAVQTHPVLPVLHPETGQQIMTRPTSTLFFIPVRFWPFIIAGIGLVVFAANLITVLAAG